MGYRPEELVRLCHALLPGDASLAKEVMLASNDSHGYYARFQRRLQSDRGMEPKDVEFPELPWMALLDGLRSRQCLEEFDWKELPELVMEGIDRLLQEQAPGALNWDWVDLKHWYEEYTWDFLKAIGDRLLGRGLLLCQFYENSDSYPVMIIDPEQLPELQRLARLSGYGDIQPLASSLPQDFQLPWLAEA